jgi:hypothetical protein
VKGVEKIVRYNDGIVYKICKKKKGVGLLHKPSVIVPSMYLSIKFKMKECAADKTQLKR